MIRISLQSNEKLNPPKIGFLTLLYVKETMERVEADYTQTFRDLRYLPT